MAPLLEFERRLSSCLEQVDFIPIIIDRLVFVVGPMSHCPIFRRRAKRWDACPIREHSVRIVFWMEDLGLRYPTIAPCGGNEFGACMQAQFCQNMRDVMADCFLANHQAFRNLRIAQTLRCQDQDLKLSFRESVHRKPPIKQLPKIDVGSVVKTVSSSFICFCHKAFTTKRNLAQRELRRVSNKRNVQVLTQGWHIVRKTPSVFTAPRDAMGIRVAKHLGSWPDTRLCASPKSQPYGSCQARKSCV